MGLAHQTSEAQKLSCLLCGAGSVTPIERLTGAEIARLWQANGRPLSAEAMAPVTPQTNIDLYACDRCGFQFYDPRFVGGGRFYEELMAGEYYSEERPEFEFVRNFAREHGVRRVLDVGGGEGAFLDGARKLGLETFGLELNVAAAERASTKGHCMISKPLKDTAPTDLGGPVDLLTLFQVVEHVPAPVEFVHAATRLIKPDGYLAIAVPNESRALGFMNLDPADWPPHHISRWRMDDLHALATKVGMRVVAAGADRLLGSIIEFAVTSNHRWAAAIGREPTRISQDTARLLSFFYRKLGLKYVWARAGLSIYVILQK